MFEIFGTDGKRKAYTETEKCVPDLAVLLKMKEAGYTFKKDGKKWVPKRGA